MWIALAFAPSSLLLGATEYVTTDIASVPLLWVRSARALPRCRSSSRSQEAGRAAGAASRGAGAPRGARRGADARRGASGRRGSSSAAHMLLLFFASVVVPSRARRATPAVARLTEFYLLLSIGGVLGGASTASSHRSSSTTLRVSDRDRRSRASARRRPRSGRAGDRATRRSRPRVGLCSLAASRSRSRSLRRLHDARPVRTGRYLVVPIRGVSSASSRCAARPTAASQMLALRRAHECTASRRSIPTASSASRWRYYYPDRARGRRARARFRDRAPRRCRRGASASSASASARSRRMRGRATSGRSSRSTRPSSSVAPQLLHLPEARRSGTAAVQSRSATRGFGSAKATRSASTSSSSTRSARTRCRCTSSRARRSRSIAARLRPGGILLATSRTITSPRAGLRRARARRRNDRDRAPATTTSRRTSRRGARSPSEWVVLTESQRAVDDIDPADTRTGTARRAQRQNVWTDDFANVLGALRF